MVMSCVRKQVQACFASTGNSDVKRVTGRNKHGTYQKSFQLPVSSFQLPAPSFQLPASSFQLQLPDPSFRLLQLLALSRSCQVARASSFPSPITTYELKQFPQLDP